MYEENTFNAMDIMAHYKHQNVRNTILSYCKDDTNWRALNSKFKGWFTPIQEVIK